MNAKPTAITPELLRNAATEAVAALKVLANTDRLLLLCQLTEGEKRVGELEALVGVTQPTLSQQLGVLRDEGLVTTRREAQTIYYALAEGPAQRILQTLHGIYCDARPLC